jgi:hypothetical protein
MEEAGGGKMSSSARGLIYGTKADYARGLNDVLQMPLLTMDQEFDRDATWTDWQGKQHTLREQWDYVMGDAIEEPQEDGRVRDRGNSGMGIEDFKQRVNQMVHDAVNSASEYICRSSARSTGGPDSAVLRRLPSLDLHVRRALRITPSALLNTEEVIAVRLCKDGR